MDCRLCGAKDFPDDAPNCPGCKRPLNRDGWMSGVYPVRRIALDTTCINLKRENPHLNQLEAWAEEGRFILERARAMIADLANDKRKERVEKATAIPGQPGVFVLGVSQLDGKDVLAGPDISTEEPHRVLFPRAKPLTENQRIDIQHIQEAVRTGSDCFVTLNTNCFIKRGKREKFVRQIGIWPFTPDEIVEVLREGYGFAVDQSV